MNNDDFIKYIFEHFKYNPDTGIITRNDRRYANGSYDKDGYLVIKIKGKKIMSHRLCWLLHFGTFPKNEIDHINHIRDDNRICNLRDITRKENHKNIRRQPNKDTGVIGIYLDKCTKGLLAKYSFRYKNKSFRFRTLEEAIKAKEELCKDL